MNSNDRYKREINRHINFWFHNPKRDSIAPDETIMKFCDLFLERLKALKFSLSLSEQTFRRNMCEAICVMYEAKKRDIGWRGPLGERPRPEWWTSKHEAEWMDNLTTNYLNYEFFEPIWGRVEEGLWEAVLPDWRSTFELIVVKYVAVRLDLIEDGKNHEIADESHGDDYYSD
jgi:hypothetical protein